MPIYEINEISDIDKIPAAYHTELAKDLYRTLKKIEEFSSQFGVSIGKIRFQANGLGEIDYTFNKKD